MTAPGPGRLFDVAPTGSPSTAPTAPPTTPRAAPDAPRPRGSCWVLVVVGWLFGSLSLTALGAPGGAREAAGGLADPPLSAFAGDDSTPAEGLDLRRAPPRELRRLPGIGPLRAAAIAEQRWRRAGEPFPLREVHGIGERTEARALGALGDERASGWGEAAPRPRDGPR